jgi:hypothetical protein
VLKTFLSLLSIACQQNAEIIAEIMIIVVPIPVKEALNLVAQGYALKKEVMLIVFLYLRPAIALPQAQTGLIVLSNVLNLLSQILASFAVNAVAGVAEVEAAALVATAFVSLNMVKPMIIVLGIVVRQLQWLLQLII